MNKNTGAEKVKKIPYKQIEKFPDPITKTPLNELSDKDKARIIFAQAYELERLSFIINQIGHDLAMVLSPVDGQ